MPVVSLAAAFQFPIQFRQQDIRQQRTQGPALRRALCPGAYHPVCHHPRFEIPSDELKHLPVFDPLREFLHQEVVIDPVEEFLQVHIDHDPPAFGHILLGCLDRLVGVPPRSEAVARFGEFGLEDR